MNTLMKIWSNLKIYIKIKAIMIRDYPQQETILSKQRTTLLKKTDTEFKE